jgi:hypothetical protein
MSNFDISTKAEMYVVYRCYFQIIILRSMFLNLHDCPFDIFKLFLISALFSVLCFSNVVNTIQYELNSI